MCARLTDSTTLSNVDLVTDFQQTDFYIIWSRFPYRGGTIVKTGNIVLTEPDHEQLNWLIASSREQCRLDAERLNDLQNELNRAIVVKPCKVPPDVVTMNSR